MTERFFQTVAQLRTLLLGFVWAQYFERINLAYSRHELRTDKARQANFKKNSLVADSKSTES